MLAVTANRKLCATLVTCVLADAAAASPFQVDSTGTAEDIELKSAFEVRDSAARRTLIAPKLAIALPLDSNLELEVGTGYRRVERDGMAKEGLADSTIELKWRLTDESANAFAVAVIPELSLPTGSQSRGLGAGHAGIVVPVVVERHVGRVMLSGQLGYGRSLGADAAQEVIPLGLLISAKPRDTLRIGMEIAGEAPRHHLSGCELSANFGFKWKASRNFEIHGLVGRTVRSPDSDPVSRFKLVAEMHL